MKLIQGAKERLEARLLPVLRKKMVRVVGPGWGPPYGLPCAGGW